MRIASRLQPKDSETESIARAYIRLEPVTGSALAQELGIEIVEEQEERGIEELKHRRLELMEAYRERDAQNIDYNIEIFNHDTAGPVATG